MGKKNKAFRYIYFGILLPTPTDLPPTKFINCISYVYYHLRSTLKTAIAYNRINKYLLKIKKMHFH